MTIDESTHQLRKLDLEDLDQTRQALIVRGRAVVEFAANADPRTLREAEAAGRALIEQLLDERRRLITQLRNARSFHGSLSYNLPYRNPSSLLA